MGVRIENHCCCCDLPCRGWACNLRRVPITFCDECGYEMNELYDRGGETLCEDCYVEAELKDAEKIEANAFHTCACCGERAEELYIIEGEGVCEDCFIDAALEGAIPVTAESLAEIYDYG